MFRVNSSQEAVDRSQVRLNSVLHFTDLLTWQKGHQVVLDIYKITATFPKAELFGLVSQMRRAAVSITSNIAEGFGRVSIKEKLHFYNFAHGSLTELENQIIICKDTGLITDVKYGPLQMNLRELDKVVSGLMRSTQKRLTNS